MKILRYLLAAAVVLLFLLLVVITGMAGDTLLSLWDRLQTAPWYIASLFALILLLFTITSVIILWKLLRPAKQKSAQKSPLDEQSLQQRINDAESSGIDIAAARDELNKLNQRRQTGKLYIALAGNISTGKSSLINSLLPGVNAQTDVTGGTTTQATEYHWETPSADEVILIDIPGLQDANNTGLSDVAREEANRAHLVIYLCDGDLTRQQMNELTLLAELEKPIILTLNKSDWYNKDERKQILLRLREHTQGIKDITIVTTSTQSTKQVVIKQADGTESTELRSIGPDIRELARALQQRIDSNPERLEKLRDSAIFTLAARSLDEAELRQKFEKGSQLEIDRLLKLGQSRLNRHIALIMAVLGNAMKAFPGLGTLAGGALHAVTYGMIFDALGRSLNEILASRGELATLPVINRFTENLGDQLEKRSSDIIRLALETREKKQK
jgi:GTP-binding protein EngB required for normal cell division